MNIGKKSIETNSVGKYFGTDGFRGEPNVSLTSEHAFKIGRFLGWYYRENSRSAKPKILIGKDTRQSSYMIEYAIAAGITASGADAYLMHVTTTPSISYVCGENHFSCGIMITASHNPYYDNGIKVINERGEKLDENTTSLIEAYLDGRIDTLITENILDLPLATRNNIGIIYDYCSGRDQYIRHLISLVTNSLSKLRIGLDCANGSSWMIAERIFSELGAKTFAIGINPDGKNINENCGSTHIDQLRDLVKREGLDAGFAFDGDADRCIAVDANGEIIDGDKIIYIIANRFKRYNLLENDTVAVTVMSNMGLLDALKTKGIGSSITAVGDKYVYQRMIENGYQLGGEQSGHIIMMPYATTGDGILTALMLADEMIETGSSLSNLCGEVNLYPQITINLKVKDKIQAVNDPTVKEKVAVLNQNLLNKGRVILRASGTENLVRLSVEAKDRSLCEECLSEITKLLREGGHLI